MNLSDNLKRIQKLYNSHEREILRILDLCHGHEDVLEVVYFRSHLKYGHAYLPDTLLKVLHLIHNKIQIKHKETGQLGYINEDYKSIDVKKILTRRYYGVQWYSGKDYKFKLTFWQTKDKFVIV